MESDLNEKRQEVGHYTDSVKPLLDFLIKIFPHNSVSQPYERRSSLHISDAVDVLGRECVDLVQEGGGVHGIALAGYTYMLESMGLSFAKMAGTSAGAINTMLLCCTLTSEEVLFLQKDLPEKPNYDIAKLDAREFYNTRSEKMLEYLSEKKLSTLVDGHSVWRKIILSLFSGQVKMEGIKTEALWWKRVGISLGLFLLAMVISIVIMLTNSTPGSCVKIATGLSFTGFLITLILLFGRLWQARLLWFLSENLGINPGDDFKEWIQTILFQNEVLTIDSLREKLELETDKFLIKQQLAARAEPTKVSKANATRYSVKDGIIADEGKNVFFLKSLEDILQRLVKLELDESSCGDCVDGNKVEILWSEFLVIAKDLPAGDSVKDYIARDRAHAMMPIFMRLMDLQDKTCGYTRNKEEINEGKIINNGPYNREITLITTDITNEIKVEFPAMHKMYFGNRFDISPANYVRASMAIPLFFTPFKFKYSDANRDVMEDEWLKFMKIRKRHEGKATYQPDKQATLFVDGGALSNFPINIYATPEMPIPRKPTIGIKLEFEDETISNTIDNLMGEVGSLISTMRYFYDRDFLSKNDMYKRTVRSIDTGQIHWLNFNLTPKDKAELFFRGALTATFFLLSGHPDFKKNQSIWYNKILNFGKEVKFGDRTPFSIYKDDSEREFRNEDRENKEIHFQWDEYKLERLLALSQVKFQRTTLKTFPKQD